MLGKTKLFYITTNEVWGGSEKLWYESVLLFLNKGATVSLAIKYHDKKVEAIKTRLSHLVNLGERYTTLSRAKRIINKITKVFKKQDILLRSLKLSKPDLVIISQGNNISSLDIMELCIQNNFRFVTISQIVTDLNWFWLNEDFRNNLKRSYQMAIRNYFVSRNNLSLHEFLLAYYSSNSEMIQNPFIVENSAVVTFPKITKCHQIAIVGRIECYHKGLDILIRVLCLKKWKERQVNFNLYGNGPHVSAIKDLLIRFDINNIFFQGHCSVIDIWDKNHILLMPSRMEGQSLALLEALYLNRTAIVTNVGGASEVIEDNVTGFIANVATMEALDEALERAWQRRFEWEELGIRAGNNLKAIMPKDPVADFNRKIIKITEGIDNRDTRIVHSLS